MFPGLGTLVNFLLVLVGSYVGLIGIRLIPQRLSTPIIHAIALFTIILGIHLVIENKPQTLKVFFILLLGTSLGYLLGLEERLESLSSDGKEFARAFVISSALFSIGPMTLLGCILEATKGDSSLLISKAIMDGFTAIFLASSLGKGVMASSLFILSYQGSITALAYFFGDFLDHQSMQNALFIGGGILLVIGFQMLGVLREVRLMNVFPSLVIALFV